MRTRTRSQLQSPEWTNIPVLVKIFKLLINELANDIEAVSAANQSIEVSDNFLWFSIGAMHKLVRLFCVRVCVCLFNVCLKKQTFILLLG